MFPGAILDKKAADRGLTSALWRDIEARTAGPDPRSGFFHCDDFHEIVTGRYTATQATSGTFALATDVSALGVALADSGATTNTQGINVQRVGATVEPAAGRIIVMEARIKGSAITTGPEFFLGWSVADTTVIASGANSSAEHVGFEVVGTDNVLLFHTEDGGTRVSGATSPATLSTTYQKLGIKIIGETQVEVWVDGAQVDVAFSAAPDIPADTILVPTLVCQSNGTTQPIIHMDWWAIGWTPFLLT